MRWFQGKVAQEFIGAIGQPDQLVSVIEVLRFGHLGPAGIHDDGRAVAVASEVQRVFEL